MSVDRGFILVVEDDSTSADLLLQMINDCLGEGRSFPSLALALLFARTVRIDAVLLDLELPDSSGLATVTATRGSLPAVPIIVVSGNSEELVAPAAIREGADDYLVKGEFTKETLARSLRYARERRQTIIRLNEAERRFRDIVENVQEGICRADSEMRIVFANRQFAAMMGYEVDELLGMSVIALTDLTERTALADRASAGVSLGEHEIRMVKKGGERFWARVLDRPLRDAEGQLVGSMATIIDVTARKEAEQALTQSESMFRTLVERRFSSPGEPQLENISVNDWFSSIQDEIVTQCWDRVSFSAEIDEHTYVVADRTQLSHLLNNLVINALDAMPAGGKLLLSARACTQGETFPFAMIPAVERFIHLRLADDGAGIDPVTLPHIFEPLFTTKPTTGSGLGLTVVHTIARLQAGLVFVESELGCGTTFHLFLPAGAPDTADEGADAGRRRGAITPGQRRILLVEDEVAVAEGIAQLLLLEGMACEIVNEGLKAASAVIAFDPHVVVLDLSLPDLDGRDVYLEIAKIRPQLPVIFSTGHGNAEDLPLSGHVLLLQKPYAIEDLLQEIDRAVTAGH